VFRDRREAGRVLARLLHAYRGKPDVVVLGLPRGGIPVAWEVAAALGVPLDPFVVRKLGAPGREEFAVGAMALGGRVVVNDDVLRGLKITPEQLREVAEREGRELLRREAAYRGGRPPADVTGKTVILVDDGLATGASMLAAVQALREKRTRADRHRDTGGPGVHVARVRWARRRRRLRVNAAAVPCGRRILLGLRPSQRRGGARAAPDPDDSRPADGCDRKPVRSGSPYRR
jgi:adenine/guanine phosphoribosyltransferase-like PRPP-binding protein